MNPDIDIDTVLYCLADYLAFYVCICKSLCLCVWRWQQKIATQLFRLTDL